MQRDIGKARKAVDSTLEAHTKALAAHSAAVVAEAERLVRERDARTELLQKAQAEHSRLQSEKAKYQATIRNAKERFMEASFQGDDGAAKVAQRAGERARKALEKLERDLARAEKALEDASFDEYEADAQLRADLGELRQRVDRGLTQDDSAAHRIAVLGAPARKRLEAATNAARIAEMEQRKAERDALPRGAVLPGGSRKW